MNYQHLFDKKKELVAAMRSITDAAKGVLSADDNAKFDSLAQQVVDIDAQIEREKKVERFELSMAASQQTPMPDINPGAGDGDLGKRMTAESKAFSNFLRKGVGGLSAHECNILQDSTRVHKMAEGLKSIRMAQTETTTGGGYLIPSGFSGKLEEALKFFGGILGNVEEFSTDTGNPLPWPSVNDTAQVGRILGINTQATETDFVFGQPITLNAYTFTSDSVLVPIQLMQDSYFDLDSFIARKLGERIGRCMNTKFTVGTGTNEPTGLMTAAIAAANKITLATGNTTSLTSDSLIDIEHAVDPAYRQGATYMFNDSTLKAIKKLKDSYGRYLWLPGLAANDPNTINGYEYVINNDVANMAANAYPAAFGNFKAYKVRRVAGDVSVLRLQERYADYLQVGYIAFVRADGNLMDAGTHPVSVLQNSAT